MPRADLHLAVAQTASVVGDIAANVAHAAALAADAAAGGAALIVFPELSLVGYELDQLEDPGSWLTEGDGRLESLRRCAANDRITIAVGAPVRLDSGQRWLALVLLSPDGRELVHGKVHLHGPEYEVFDAAPAATGTVEIAGWRLAPAICFDVAVPDHAAHAAVLGTDVYLGSALYVEGEERRVDLHFASRAMDHRMYSVFANHSGPSPLGTALGGSGMWSPTGERVHEAGREPELLLLRLDAAAVDRFRSPP